MTHLQKYMKSIVLFSASFLIVLGYQNCGTNNVAFSKLDAVFSSNQTDFSIEYTKTVEVNSIGQFSASTTTGNLEEVIWSFEDGESLNGASGLRTFNEAGKVRFTVKAKFAGEEQWITKNGLHVDVISSNTCIDLDNVRILSDQIDFKDENATWPQNEAFSAYLNFNTCATNQHLYDVQWTILAVNNPDTPIVQRSGAQTGDITLDLIQDYEIQAKLTYAHDPEPRFVSERFAISSKYTCKPKSGIEADKDLESLVVGSNVTFAASLFPCLGHTMEIEWFVEGKSIGDTNPIRHTFNEVKNDVEIRAIIPKEDGGVEQHSLFANIVNGYHWTCDLRCYANGENTTTGVFPIEPGGPAMACADSNGHYVDAGYCKDQELPVDVECPAVCIDDPPLVQQ